MNSSAALAHLTKELRRLQKADDYKGLKAYLGSPRYRDLAAALTPHDTVKMLRVMGDVQAKLLPTNPLPPRWSLRVRWTPERIEALRKAEARYGEDEAIARALGIPWENARRARRRYLGYRVASATGHQR